MSCYVLNLLSHPDVIHMKAQYLVDFCGAQHIHEPTTFEGRPPGFVYINVIDNVSFEAAMVILTPRDFRAAKYDTSGRKQTWLLAPVANIRPMVEMRYLDEPALRES